MKRVHSIVCFSAGLVLTGCHAKDKDGSFQTPPVAASHLAVQDGLPVIQLADSSGLHNVFKIGSDFYSGSGPEGDVGFENLQKLGVRTIISVDGVAPDVTRAKSLGMRYVHFPVGYEGIPVEKQRRIAKAVRDLPKPVYLHCHHGKHRGPAAMASAAVLLGVLTSDQGLSFLKQAGTADTYTGLYACVASASAAGDAQLDAINTDFPETAPVSGLIPAMVTIDEVYEHLMLIQKAGWKVPSDHPDLVPSAEAKQLAETLAAMKAEQPSNAADFETMRDVAICEAKALESLLKEPVHNHEQLDARMKALKTSCTACHAQLRDHRKF